MQIVSTKAGTGSGAPSLRRVGNTFTPTACERLKDSVDDDATRCTGRRAQSLEPQHSPGDTECCFTVLIWNRTEQRVIRNFFFLRVLSSELGRNSMMTQLRNHRSASKQKKQKVGKGETVGVLAAASKAVSALVADLADLYLQRSNRAKEIKRMCSLVHSFSASFWSIMWKCFVKATATVPDLRQVYHGEQVEYLTDPKFLHRLPFSNLLWSQSERLDLKRKKNSRIQHIYS